MAQQVQDQVALQDQVDPQVREKAAQVHDQAQVFPQAALEGDQNLSKSLKQGVRKKKLSERFVSKRNSNLGQSMIISMRNWDSHHSILESKTSSATLENLDLNRKQGSKLKSSKQMRLSTAS